MPFPKRYLPDQVTRHEFEIKRDVSARVDVWLTGRLPELSRALIQRFVREGRVKVNGRVARASSRVRRGDRVEIEVPHVIRPKMIPTEMPLEILYEDEHLIALNKPAGVVMHPATGHWKGTLVNAVVAHLKIPVEATDIVRPGIVHRLDKETSGVVVLGKSHTGLSGLAGQFQDRTIEKEYRAVVHGAPEPKRGVIDLPIARRRDDDERMGVARRGTGKEARTRYEVLEGFRLASYVSVVPLTGRQHQIRVHLSSRGNPCVGDPLYEGEERKLLWSDLDPSLPAEPAMRRQALHAYRLSFAHPATGRAMDLVAPLAEDMVRLLAACRTAKGPPSARR